MRIPDWWEVLLLGAAAWRTFQLLALDKILDRPRRYVTGLGWSWREGQRVPAGYHSGMAEFIECPYCLGAWIAVAWWGAWLMWPHGTVVASVPFALSAVVIGLAQVIASE